MKKIIKEGHVPPMKVYSCPCPECGCEFIYDEEDIEEYEIRPGVEQKQIECPTDRCGNYIVHLPENEIK
jgi:hypothetical protein